MFNVCKHRLPNPHTYLPTLWGPSSRTVRTVICGLGREMMTQFTPKCSQIEVKLFWMRHQKVPFLITDLYLAQKQKCKHCTYTKILHLPLQFKFLIWGKIITEDSWCLLPHTDIQEFCCWCVYDSVLYIHCYTNGHKTASVHHWLEKLHSLDYCCNNETGSGFLDRRDLLLVV